MDVSIGQLEGVLVFTPTPHRDARGYFTRTFDAEVALRAGLDGRSFVQDSQSRSMKGAVRGLHFRTDAGEGKLVRCSFGRVFDVAVDLRPSSPTFGRHQELILDDESHLSVYLPPGLAHGFQALTDVADVCYRIDAVHRPEADATIVWNDPDLAIRWPLPVTQMSERDRRAPSLREFLAQRLSTPASLVDHQPSHPTAVGDSRG